MTDVARASLFPLPHETALLLDAISEYAVISLDESGRIASWNAGASRLFGYEAAETTGQFSSRLLAPAETGRTSSNRNLHAARDGGHVLEEAWYVRRDGSRFFGRGMLGVILDAEGHTAGFVKLVHDDTDRKTREDLAMQSKRADEQGERVIRQMIHDLRTPLSALTLWTSLIAEAGTMSPAQLTEALGAIRRSSEELQVLVERFAASRAFPL